MRLWVGCLPPGVPASLATTLWSSGGVVDEEGGEWEVWDEAPEGQFSRNAVLPPGQHFRTDVQPMGHEHGFFWAVEFALCALPPAAPKSPPRKKPFGDSRGTIHITHVGPL